jgi:predicted 5'-methylthioadenosine/S-adenosylhomocysteine nucleosidase
VPTTDAPPGILIVSATELELCGYGGLMCGIGPVEAAVVTARALAVEEPRAVLHVGVAGGRRLTPGALVVGTESVYVDLGAAIPVTHRVRPDPQLLSAAQAALPEAVALPIATSASVSGSASARFHDLRVEGMEGFGVLRACELAGVPAVEVRAISNELGEADRALWMIRRGLESLSDALPRLLAALAE